MTVSGDRNDLSKRQCYKLQALTFVFLVAQAAGLRVSAIDIKVHVTRSLHLALVEHVGVDDVDECRVR